MCIFKILIPYSKNKSTILFLQNIPIFQSQISYFRLLRVGYNIQNVKNGFGIPTFSDLTSFINFFFTSELLRPQSRGIYSILFYNDVLFFLETTF